LQIADKPDGDPILATIGGEIDVTNTDDFTRAVSGLSGNRPVVVDLSPLRYLDSAGFAALDRLIAEGSAVIVISPQSLVRRAAVVMELPFHHDTDSALQAAQARA
jgi:anti-anti-sigma factor